MENEKTYPQRSNHILGRDQTCAKFQRQERKKGNQLKGQVKQGFMDQIRGRPFLLRSGSCRKTWRDLKPGRSWITKQGPLFQALKYWGS
jgi:hypothetical protein